MCGIVGIVNNGERPIDRALLERMNQRIKHRGPDEEGFYIKENVGLAMRRLSIIDLAGGQQPIHNQDKTKWIVFNGEIYNYRELRKYLEKDGARFYTHSDTEVILHLYERLGSDCLEQLRGMFAFAIWDERKKELFLARDRVGKKPLLYCLKTNGDLIFGSEFQAIIEHPDISREIDPEALNAYLVYLCVPAPMTIYRDVRKLEPAHWLIWKDGKIETRRYWMPDYSKKIKISKEEAIEETTRLVEEATRLRMIAEVPLGAFLSGGVDSSMVVALMARNSDQPVKTFSIGFEEEDFSELKYARKVAQHVGADHHEFIVKPQALEILPTLVEHYGEPFADSSAIPSYYVARETRRHVTVALNGDGGDESFAGYERYQAMKLGEAYRSIPNIIRKPLIEIPLKMIPTSEVKRSRLRDIKRFTDAASLSSTERYGRWICAFNRASRNKLLTQEFQKNIFNDPLQFINAWVGNKNGIGLLDTTLKTDLLTYLPNDLLVKMDIASMANSLEARSPFLDHKVIEFAASLPERLKMRLLDTKTLLKSAAARLVPKEVIYRQKMGFGVPVGRWFLRELKPLVTETLLGEKLARRGILNAAEVKNYVNEHLEMKKDHSYRIWTLLMLELWFQRFID
jgi:asparagine synthase (glutamine-hydrolysing)